MSHEAKNGKRELARGVMATASPAQNDRQAATATIERAEELIRAEMEKWGIFAQGWTYGIEQTRYRFGVADFKNKQLRISAPFILVNGEAELLDTIRHEIAHVRAGIAAGHGRLWKIQAITVGARPEACCGKNVVAPDMKYHAICPKCSHKFKVTRLPTTKDKRSKERRPYAGSCGHCVKGWNRTQANLDACLLQWIETATGQAIEWPPKPATAATVEPVEAAPSAPAAPEVVFSGKSLTNAVQESLF